MQKHKCRRVLTGCFLVALAAAGCSASATPEAFCARAVAEAKTMAKENKMRLPAGKQKEIRSACLKETRSKLEKNPDYISTTTETCKNSKGQNWLKCIKEQEGK